MEWQKKTCAFTGYRPKLFSWNNNELDERCIALRVAITEQIKALTERGVMDFLCGIVPGADFWCASAVLGLRKTRPALKLHCILPCRGYACAWPKSFNKHYDYILGQADSIILVNQEYHMGCMQERDNFLVEHASILLAVYKKTLWSGGDATVDYARKLGREVIMMDPVTRSITHEKAVSE